jgi:pimeloyl-ACP methyl ester carboxylesterase
MEGGKAAAVDGFAAARGLTMLRFDYSGTGSSGGNFEDGTLAVWLEESLAAVDRLTTGPVVVIGSSMGGWIGLHLALQRPQCVQAMVGIATATDFTDWGFSPQLRAFLRERGKLEEPNPNGRPHVMTHAFWQSGQELRLLTGEIGIDCPVRLIHGDSDTEVPVDIALRTMRALRSRDVQVTIVKGGRHRLSEPHEIDLILRTVAELLEPAP